MMRTYKYKCECGATKTIIDAPLRRGELEYRVAPSSVPCGWRGCDGEAKRIETKDMDERERLRYEWAGYLSGISPMSSLHPEQSLPLVNASLDFLRGLTDEERKELLG